MGVTSVIAVTSIPAAWSDRIACSRPAPGPFTYTSTWRMPCSIARRAAPSADRAPADDRAGRVRDRDDRVVERRLDVDVSGWDVLLLTAALFGRLLAFGH